MSDPYWLTEAAISGSKIAPKDGSIIIVGSGLTGVSCAYWLLDRGVTDVVMVDFECEKAASFRNCGHILYGTVESMKALSSLYGFEDAKALWQFSVDICDEIKNTVLKHNLASEYRQDGYLCVAIDEPENAEILDSIRLLREMGFGSDYVTKEDLVKLGFNNTHGGRYEAGSAQAHPVKFRNELLSHCLKKGLKYHSGVEVLSLEDDGNGVSISTKIGQVRFDAAIIAANAYSPLFSDFFSSRRLVEPFRGQIIASAPLQHRFAVCYPHSFDHGYEYAIVSADNRLIIGGWRNHTPTGEIGTYDLTSNPNVDLGLKQFVAKHYSLNESITWQYSWTGIMASSKTGLPFIGPTNAERIFCCAGYTGHGFSWAHGCAKLLVKIILGDSIPPLAKFFNPTAGSV